MITLFLRYTLNPNKMSDFKTYVDAEMEPIRRSGGQIVGYFLPTDFAGPTNEACGLIDFESLAAYEKYRACSPLTRTQNQRRAPGSKRCHPLRESFANQPRSLNCRACSSRDAFTWPY